MNCSRYHSIQIGNRHDSRTAQFDFNALHCATWKPSSPNDWQADPGTWRALAAAVCEAPPSRTCSRYHSVQTSFRRRTKGAICSENRGLTMFQLELLAGTRLFRTRSDYKKWCVCSENMFPLELYREQVWTPGRCIQPSSNKSCILV